jgi:hypothetical protein
MDIKHCAEQRQESVFCTVQIKNSSRRSFKLLRTDVCSPPFFSGRKAEKAMLGPGNCAYLYAYTRRLYGNTFYLIYLLLRYTDKKENQLFLIYKEIQNIRKPFLEYDFATAPL